MCFAYVLLKRFLHSKAKQMSRKIRILSKNQSVLIYDYTKDDIIKEVIVATAVYMAIMII